MNLFRSLLLLVFSLVLLATLWPLFVLLLIGLALYWLYFKRQFAKMVQKAQSEQSTPSHPDTIDAEYTERHDA